MRLALALTLVVLPQAALGAEECPASLILNVEQLSVRDMQAAQRYASCVSVPWLPTKEQRAEKLADCLKDRAVSPSDKLSEVFNWVDHIAAEFPACETRLEIKGTST